AVGIPAAAFQHGRGVFRCGIDENPGMRLLEILKALLRYASFPDSDVVIQGQHRSLLSPGGADAKITKPAESGSIQTVSSTPEAPVLAGAASRNQAENSKVAGATAARAHRKSPRLRQQKGGGRRVTRS